MPQAAEIPLDGTVVTTVLANLRHGAPRLAAPVARKVPAGTSVSVVALAVGDEVQGNAHWYRTDPDGYLWAGACGPLATGATQPAVSVPPPPAVPIGSAAGPVSAGALTAALAACAPRVNAFEWTPALMAGFRKYDLNNPRRVAAALGQFLVEADDGFHGLEEGLFYSHADRIASTFHHAFANAAAAEPYVGKPEKLANFVYADAEGNGDVASGDGYRFRGRGLIQLTHRDTYAEFGKTVGKTAEAAAAYCETQEGAAMSGCWFLSSRHCLTLADNWEIDRITRVVNPKSLGAKQRKDFANAFRTHFGAA
jgi:predicted chitinase